jgi:muramidase (phage lysozyme)
LTRTDLQAALDNRNVRAFLAMLRYGEGTADDMGYYRIVGGGNAVILDDHPRVLVRLNPKLKSTAAGAYQILSRTWDGMQHKYGWADFSEESQDECAVALIAGRRALGDVIAGRIKTAIRKCNREWASLPGSPYGQRTETLADALKYYGQHGGIINE